MWSSVSWFISSSCSSSRVGSLLFFFLSGRSMNWLTTRSRHTNGSLTSGWKYVTYLSMMCFLLLSSSLFTFTPPQNQLYSLFRPERKSSGKNFLTRRHAKWPGLLEEVARVVGGGVHHTKGFQVQLGIVRNAFVNVRVSGEVVLRSCRRS